MHIRNLMITYFFKFFRATRGMTATFTSWKPRSVRVRNKEKTIYCYSEAERDSATHETRRQTGRSRGSGGLGEISPREFAQFIGKDMRLSQVEYAPRVESGPIFDFYMRQKHSRNAKGTTSWTTWS